MRKHRIEVARKRYNGNIMKSEHKTFPILKDIMSLVKSNKIIIKNISGVSRLTTSLVTAPLKIFNPNSSSHWCHLVLSNYGGGYISGDDIRIEITCENQSLLYLGTQGNTRIYKQAEGKESRQSIIGNVKSQSIAVIAPDPTVLHEGSYFKSKQMWSLATDANLVLTDWIHSGRYECNESFHFHSYESEISIYRNAELVLLDQLLTRPGELDPNVIGRFGPYRMLLNIFLIGNKVHRVAQELQTCCCFNEKRRLRDLVREPSVAPKYPDQFCSLSEFMDDGYVFRALGRNKIDLEKY